MGFTANIIEGALNMSVYLRSSDVVVGLPYDYMAYGFLMHFMCNTLNVKPGILCLDLAHAHYYHVHNDVVSNALTSSHSSNWVSGPVLLTDVSEATMYADDIMAHPLRQANGNEYNPKPELVL